jgi:propanediol utilization protein
MFVAASLIAPGRAVGQTRQYVVIELSRTDAPGVPCKLNNLGDIAGRTGGALEGELKAAVTRTASIVFLIVALLL